MEQFDLNDYLFAEKLKKDKADTWSFDELCSKVKDLFYVEWERAESSKAALEMQKRAIIGYVKEKNFFMERITNLIRELNACECSFPEWYRSIEDAVYQEIWGLAGLSEWFLPEYAQSSSAKIIGERIYFLKDGRMQLRKQPISEERKMQLIKAFLLLTPSERLDRDYYELYLLDGTRVTIFMEPMAKAGRSSIILRRYLVPNFSFEEQARRGTIPFDAIPLFRYMVKLGFNVAFLGAVRTAKTTFLSTWQSYEDPSLEGVMVETDPEISMDSILPGAPILQLIADGEELKKISKNLLRSDADYFILAEARDGIALDTAVRIASKGTKRLKMTYHSRYPERFPLEAATEIVKATGGDIRLTMQMVAASFDYLFYFVQLKDKSKKRLNAVYQMNCDKDGNISFDTLCSYDFTEKAWRFKATIGDAQRQYAMETDDSALRSFEEELVRLSERGLVL